jgi:hypothetical protein
MDIIFQTGKENYTRRVNIMLVELENESRRLYYSIIDLSKEPEPEKEGEYKKGKLLIKDQLTFNALINRGDCIDKSRDDIERALRQHVEPENFVLFFEFVKATLSQWPRKR